MHSTVITSVSAQIVPSTLVFPSLSQFRCLSFFWFAAAIPGRRGIPPGPRGGGNGIPSGPNMSGGGIGIPSGPSGGGRGMPLGPIGGGGGIPPDMADGGGGGGGGGGDPTAVVSRNEMEIRRISMNA